MRNKLLATTILLMACNANASDLGRLMAAEFERAGLTSALAEVGARKQALLKSGGVGRATLKATVAQSPSPQMAIGVMVRFKDPAIQRLAERGLPPPADAVAVIQSVAGQRLTFHRAMSGGIHVFRLDAPVSVHVLAPSIEAIKRVPIVEVAEPDAIANSSQVISSDPYVAAQWNLKGRREGYAGGIDALATWPITYGTDLPVVAVIDTGVLPHPEFSSRRLPGYDFVSNASLANDGDGRDADAEDPGDWTAAGECGPGSVARKSSWHGTHVAGIIAADGSNGFGIAGVTWRARVLPVRVLGKCGGNFSDILDGIQWAAGLPVPNVPANANPAHILNLSLGGLNPNGCPTLVQEFINRALGQGALVVVAAGNASDDAARYVPASCKGALIVMATDHVGIEASYTNFDFKGVGIAAPGGDARFYGTGYGILSTIGTGETTRGNAGFGERDGTSMAAPHVAGVAALALSINPNLAGAELAFLMQYTSSPFASGSHCQNLGVCGAGIVNAYATSSVANLLKDRSLIYEFYNSGANHFFRTGAKAEAFAVNRGSAGPGWYETGNYFYAWNTQVGSTVPVCRFYSTRANSHFYTANAGECADVKRNPDWTYEGISFYANLPAGGRCNAGETPVYRAYNNRHATFDMNHRFTTEVGTYQEMIRQGWLGEGVALCV